jgi:stearoyl-CoA 9-desaturase NADPH oxidoreductase
MDTTTATPTLTPVATRVRRRVRSVAAAVTTPLVPEDFLDLVAPVRSRSTLRARIVEVRPETRDAATIVLRPGPTWRPHVPGQFLRVGVDVDGVRLWRAYSLTSVPQRPDGTVSITVKAIPGGRVSTHLVRNARAGDLFHLDQAAGEFVLPAPAPARTLFLAAGSGVTPIVGMLRSHLDELDDVVVVHCATSRDDAIFGDELRDLAGCGRIRLVEVLADRDGLLDPVDLATIVPDVHEREVWACGPAGLLGAVERHWAAAGLASRLHVERFVAAVAVDAGDGGTVSFVSSGREVEVAGDQSILDAGEAAGVLMPSGCRMGICFGCVVPLRAGAVRDLRTGEVTTVDTGEDVSVQTCISTAVAGCRIAL